MHYSIDRNLFNIKLRQVLLLILMLVMLVPNAPAQALPGGSPAPGGTFEKSSGIGLTGPYNAPVSTSSSTNFANMNGVKLDLSRQGVYYFYFYLVNPGKVTFWIYTNQALGRQVSQFLYDNKRKEITHTSSTRCERNIQPCTAILVSPSLLPGAYTLKIVLPPAKTGVAWLMTDISGLTGNSPTAALPWYNQEDLYGQIPAITTTTPTPNAPPPNQWYKVNLAAGGKYTLRLFGTPGSNLNLYVYSDSNTSKPIASGTSGNYPESVQVSVPSRTNFVYLRVENAKKTNAEYYILVTR